MVWMYVCMYVCMYVYIIYIYIWCVCNRFLDKPFFARNTSRTMNKNYLHISGGVWACMTHYQFPLIHSQANCNPSWECWEPIKMTGRLTSLKFWEAFTSLQRGKISSTLQCALRQCFKFSLAKCWNLPNLLNNIMYVFWGFSCKSVEWNTICYWECTSCCWISRSRLAQKGSWVQSLQLYLNSQVRACPLRAQSHHPVLQGHDTVPLGWATNEGRKQIDISMQRSDLFLDTSSCILRYLAMEVVSLQLLKLQPHVATSSPALYIIYCIKLYYILYLYYIGFGALWVPLKSAASFSFSFSDFSHGLRWTIATQAETRWPEPTDMSLDAWRISRTSPVASRKISNIDFRCSGTLGPQMWQGRKPIQIIQIGSEKQQKKEDWRNEHGDINTGDLEFKAVSQIWWRKRKIVAYTLTAGVQYLSVTIWNHEATVMPNRSRRVNRLGCSLRLKVPMGSSPPQLHPGLLGPPLTWRWFRPTPPSWPWASWSPTWPICHLHRWTPPIFPEARAVKELSIESIPKSPKNFCPKWWTHRTHGTHLTTRSAVLRTHIAWAETHILHQWEAVSNQRHKGHEGHEVRIWRVAASVGAWIVSHESKIQAPIPRLQAPALKAGFGVQHSAWPSARYFFKNSKSTISCTPKLYDMYKWRATTCCPALSQGTSNSVCVWITHLHAQNLTPISIPGHQVTPAVAAMAAVAAVAAVKVSSTGPPLLVYTATASLLIMFSSDGKRGHGCPKQEQVPRIGGWSGSATCWLICVDLVMFVRVNSKVPYVSICYISHNSPVYLV